VSYFSFGRESDGAMIQLLPTCAFKRCWALLDRRIVGKFSSELAGCRQEAGAVVCASMDNYKSCWVNSA